MKFRVHMKSPDALSSAIRDVVMGRFPDPESGNDFPLHDRAELAEELKAKASRFFTGGEFLTVEIDTDAGTCVVVPKDKPALKPAMPPEVKRAFDEVLKYHPEINAVVFTEEGRWFFFESDSMAGAKFHSKLDVSVLEAAVDALDNTVGLPQTFQLSMRM